MQLFMESNSTKSIADKELKKTHSNGKFISKLIQEANNLPFFDDVTLSFMNHKIIK